jgi:uncharacterized membrane-anchored protein
MNEKNSASMIKFPVPANLPQRYQLNNEVHARPYAALYAPERATHLALMMNPAQKEQERDHLATLCQRYVHPLPAKDADHFSADFGAFRLRWEQHSEFSTYTFFEHGPFAEPFAESVLRKVPTDWMEGLPGQLVVGAHAAIQPPSDGLPDLDAISPLFQDNSLVGSEVSGGAAYALTDFRIHADGFSRFLIIDRHLRSRQAGRLLQRLFEVEVYRMMALLSFPIARKLIPQLNGADQRLLGITNAMAESASNETELLDELTSLASEIEFSQSSTQYRLNASQAYFGLVERRIQDMREQRIQGIQTFREFMDRRLEPAMNTCASVERRQTALSKRIARASQLLRTRVEITLQRQNQSLLESMDRRAKLQLRLQETVEGLSIAAITYYSVSLISYVAKAGKAMGWPIEPDLVVGASIPVMALALTLGVRYVRKAIAKGQAQTDL